MGASASLSPSGSPNSRRHQSSASPSLSNCGGDHKAAPHAGRGPLFQEHRDPPLPSPRSTRSPHAPYARAAASCRATPPGVPRARRYKNAHGTHGAGRSCARAQGRAQIHDGLGIGAHSFRGRARLGPRPQPLVTAAELGSPSMPNTRASTRFTLPSRIGCRSPRDSARIAPAVDRPMPGSAVTASSPCGNSPPCSATSTCAQACKFRARA
jgi:hypothetical protein